MTIAQLHDNFLKSSGVCTDTRSITKNSIFFALKGGNFNGNKYAINALESGCLLAVVDEDVGSHEGLVLVDDVLSALQDLASYHRNKLQCPVLAIVGSNGKTTTKELLLGVLSKKYNVCATKGNLNNHIGVPLTILTAKLDTGFLLVEMGANHQGEIKILCEIAKPDHGVLANIGLAHLEGFGGIEGVKKGKTELYRYLNKVNGLVFFNNDEPSIQEFKDYISEIHSYGVETDVRVGSVSISDGSLHLEVMIEIAPCTVRSKLFGEYNVNNILTAMAVGHYFKVDTKKMVSAIEDYTPENNRSQLKITSNQNILVLDAYNANPTSMSNAIQEFSKLNNGSNYYILGDMLELGSESAKEHLKILTSLNSKKGIKLLVGEEFAIHKFAYGKNDDFHFFDDVVSLKLELRNLNIRKANILIKGSRGVALEKTLPEL
ncbi:MAG: UDP-N-acetylmuramoyl-tripeptide--D-alanyl-D-alanine ligase [Saprospiraceae bacterium]|jgi:UDP-N-acetylmuramoyl-tripeptide--D-alanyl-D-alanine ligase